MADPNVQRWRQRGRIAMWMEPNGRDSRWNISADETGCQSMVELLGLMENARWSSKVIVKLTALTATANGDGANFHFAKTAILAFPKGRVPDMHWKLTNNEQLSLEIGLQRLIEFRSAIVDIRDGNGDYSVGDESAGLWVWWWIGHAKEDAE